MNTFNQPNISLTTGLSYVNLMGTKHTKCDVWVEQVIVIIFDGTQSLEISVDRTHPPQHQREGYNRVQWEPNTVVCTFCMPQNAVG